MMAIHPAHHCMISYFGNSQDDIGWGLSGIPDCSLGHLKFWTSNEGKHGVIPWVQYNLQTKTTLGP